MEADNKRATEHERSARSGEEVDQILVTPSTRTPPTSPDDGASRAQGGLVGTGNVTDTT